MHWSDSPNIYVKVFEFTYSRSRMKDGIEAGGGGSDASGRSAGGSLEEQETLPSTATFLMSQNSTKRPCGLSEEVQPLGVPHETFPSKISMAPAA